MTNGDYDDDDAFNYLYFAFSLPVDGFSLRPKHVEINKTYINLIVIDGFYFPSYCSSMTTGCR